MAESFAEARAQRNSSNMEFNRKRFLHELQMVFALTVITCVGMVIDLSETGDVNAIYILVFLVAPIYFSKASKFSLGVAFLMAASRFFLFGMRFSKLAVLFFAFGIVYSLLEQMVCDLSLHLIDHLGIGKSH